MKKILMCVLFVSLVGLIFSVNVIDSDNFVKTEDVEISSSGETTYSYIQVHDGLQTLNVKRRDAGGQVISATTYELNPRKLYFIKESLVTSNGGFQILFTVEKNYDDMKFLKFSSSLDLESDIDFDYRVAGVYKDTDNLIGLKETEENLSHELIIFDNETTILPFTCTEGIYFFTNNHGIKSFNDYKYINGQHSLIKFNNEGVEVMTLDYEEYLNILDFEVEEDGYDIVVSNQMGNEWRFHELNNSFEIESTTIIDNDYYSNNYYNPYPGAFLENGMLTISSYNSVRYLSIATDTWQEIQTENIYTNTFESLGNNNFIYSSMNSDMDITIRMVTPYEDYLLFAVVNDDGYISYDYKITLKGEYASVAFMSTSYSTFSSDLGAVRIDLSNYPTLSAIQYQLETFEQKHIDAGNHQFVQYYDDHEIIYSYTDNNTIRIQKTQIINDEVTDIEYDILDSQETESYYHFKMGIIDDYVVYYYLKESTSFPEANLMYNYYEDGVKHFDEDQFIASNVSNLDTYFGNFNIINGMINFSLTNGYSYYGDPYFFDIETNTLHQPILPVVPGYSEQMFLLYQDNFNLDYTKLRYDSNFGDQVKIFVLSDEFEYVLLLEEELSSDMIVVIREDYLIYQTPTSLVKRYANGDITEIEIPEGHIAISYDYNEDYILYTNDNLIRIYSIEDMTLVHEYLCSESVGERIQDAYIGSDSIIQYIIQQYPTNSDTYSLSYRAFYNNEVHESIYSHDGYIYPVKNQTTLGNPDIIFNKLLFGEEYGISNQIYRDTNYLFTENTEEELPSANTCVKLLGNYPNPFNPETRISFNVSEQNTPVDISIYNIKGQKVKDIVKDVYSSGNHSVVWNGSNENNKQVSSGIYFYKIKSGRYSKTKKMVLMK